MAPAIALSISTSSPDCAPPQDDHLTYLDGLRGLAALYVMWDHIWAQVWPSYDGAGSRIGVLTSWLGYGHFAVSVFIVISGFCLMLPVVRGDGSLRGGAWTFLKKRARRILPPYYLSMALSLVLIWLFIGQKTGTHWDVSLPVTEANLLSHIFLIQDIFHSDAINHVFWSLAVEWHIYLLFPLLILLCRRRGTPVVLLCTVALSYVLYVCALVGNFIGTQPQYLGLFAIGALGAHIAYARTSRWAAVARMRIPWTLLAIGMTSVLGKDLLDHGMLTVHPSNLSFATDVAVGVCAATFLIAASRSSRASVRRLLSWRPLVFVGTFAYSLYLIHAPLIQVIWQYVVHPLRLGAGPTFLLLVLIGTPLIVLAAYLFFRVCERPFTTQRAVRGSVADRTSVRAGVGAA